MNLTTLTLADLYAVKSEAKIKEEYFRGLGYANIEDTEKAAAFQKREYWGEVITETDREIIKRIESL